MHASRIDANRAMQSPLYTAPRSVLNAGFIAVWSRETSESSTPDPTSSSSHSVACFTRWSLLTYRAIGATALPHRLDASYSKSGQAPVQCRAAGWRPYLSHAPDTAGRGPMPPDARPDGYR